MDLVKIKEKAFELMGNRKAHLEREVGGIYYHGQRTAGVAIALRNQIMPNDNSYDDIITAAAYFHDCAKGIEPHAKYGAAVAKEALEGLVNEQELKTICEIISKHASRYLNDDTTPDYVKVFQDADLVEHFGIYEIWMNFQYYAHTDGSLHDVIKYYEQNHLNHVTKNRELLNYEISKKVFDEKISFEKQFIERLRIEGTGGICYDFSKHK